LLPLKTIFAPSGLAVPASIANRQGKRQNRVSPLAARIQQLTIGNDKHLLYRLPNAACYAGKDEQGLLVCHFSRRPKG
jgi:hypothetical protein